MAARYTGKILEIQRIIDEFPWRGIVTGSYVDKGVQGYCIRPEGGTRSIDVPVDMIAHAEIVGNAKRTKKIFLLRPINSQVKENKPRRKAKDSPP